MECVCGYSCGTDFAFQRHLARFPNASADEHRLAAPDDVAQPARQQQPQMRPKSAVGATRMSRLRRAAGRTQAAESEAPVGTVPDPATSAASAASTGAQAVECEPASRTTRFSRLARSPAVANGTDAARTPLVLQGQSNADATPLRLLLVRHARSENRGRADGEPALPDPGLTGSGHEQAEAVGARLVDELHWASCFTIVSSPARRCLLTIQPALDSLKPLPQGTCFCHGGSYEYRQCGTDFRGTPWKQIAADFPEFQPVGFAEADLKSGLWDYRGSSPKETEQEVRERALRFAEWLVGDAASALRAKQRSIQAQQSDAAGSSSNGKAPAVLVLVTHQTFVDLLQHFLLHRTDERWEYAALVYKLQNAGITEISLGADGKASLTWMENDGDHLSHLKSRTAR